jgi:YesN/AraC family two-component response regulator
MSECYYSHVFKLETGIGVKDYINQVRIKKAKQLLRETDLKIAGIALAIGITNTNYFSVFFKRLTDKTPIEYRNLPGE